MSFEQILLSRRSIRAFQDKKISEELIEKIQHAIYFSPSSRGLRPYISIIVNDKTLIETLSHSKHGAELLSTAPLAIILAGDTEKSDVFIEDCSIAAANVLNICEENKLGACWVQIRNRQHDENTTADNFVKKHTGIPENFSVECIIAIGYPAEIKKPYTKEEFKNSSFYYNKYGNNYTKT